MKLGSSEMPEAREESEAEPVGRSEPPDGSELEPLARREFELPDWSVQLSPSALGCAVCSMFDVAIREWELDDATITVDPAGT